jgi:hypothetical protein
VGPVGRVEEGLGARGDLAAMVQHDFADLDADIRAAGLAGAEDGATLPLEPVGEQARLGRLARPVAASRA